MQSRGFTLIEVLLALSLLAMIMVLAYQGLSTGADMVTKGTATIERTNQIRLVQTFLRSQLSRARPTAFDSGGELGKVVFEGGRHVMRFVAPMPGYLSFGGAYIQTLSVVSDGSSQSLVFGFQVLEYGEQGAEAADSLESPEPVVLMTGIEEAEFSYLAPPESMDGEPHWVDSWENVSRLPLMVRIDLTLSEASRIRWPAFRVAMKITADGTGRSSTIQFGPLPPRQGLR